MKKKLPEIFHNSIDKKLDNNEDIFYSAKDENIKKDSKNNQKDITIRKSIKQKINEIFASSNYIYKANVVIKTNEGIVNKRIIGRNSKYLITMDNEKLPIDNIIDIEKEK